MKITERWHLGKGQSVVKRELLLTPKQELDAMVRDFTAVGSRPKSEVRHRIKEYAKSYCLMEVATAYKNPTISTP